MNLDQVKSAVEAGNIEWQKHSLERMLERGVSRAQVKQVILNGVIIEDYPGDTPYPSALFFGWAEGRPLHVVVAFDSQAVQCHIITAYVPDPKHFEPDYKTRRRHENQ